MNRWSMIFSLFLVVGLSGCASMSADECAVSDWHTIGFEDGARGYTADRLGNHRKACAKHGVSPDFTAYQAGRDQGLRQYCQASRGFNLGARGAQYSGVCPADLEPAFVDAFNSGHRLYVLRANVNSTNYQINSKRSELDAAEHRAVEAGIELVAAETPTEDRILLLAELKDLSERTGQLESEIETLIEDRVLYEQELAEYEAYIADVRY